jgi:hypothetical protein
MSQQWKEPITVPIYKKGDKVDCIIKEYNLSTKYKNVSNILLSVLTPYIDTIIGNHQCGFWRNIPNHSHIQWNLYPSFFRGPENVNDTYGKW